MSLQVTELADPGRTFAEDSNGGLTGDRTFVVYDDAGTITISGILARSAPGIPQMYDFHPDHTLLRVLQAVPTPIMGRANTWRVVVEYGLLDPGISDPDPTEPDPGEPGYIEYNTSIHAEWVVGWRSNTSQVSPYYAEMIVPGAGVGSWLQGQVPRTDIRGTPIDSQGEPASYEVRMMSLDVTEIHTSPPPWAVYRGLINKRNFPGFLGAELGTVLYKGVDVDRVAHNRWQAVHHFWHDEMYHLRQYPKRGEDGKAVIDTSSAGNAVYVYFMQPYPQMADFNILGFRL